MRANPRDEGIPVFSDCAPGRAAALATSVSPSTRQPVVWEPWGRILNGTRFKRSFRVALDLLQRTFCHDCQ